MLIRSLVFGLALLASHLAFAMEIPNWEWHAVEGSRCRDGSEAGFFLRRRAFDERLIILLGGGGACFNLLTCSANPREIGNQYPLNEGIFADREDNPVQAWNQIFVPYCSGDIHGGNRQQVPVSGLVKRQDFLGHQNIGLILEEVAKLMPNMEHLVFSGVSAGGFGAIMNYAGVRARFPDVPVTLLDDSGVPLEDAYIDPCLQKRFRETWGLNATFPEDCDACRPEDGGGLINFASYIRDRFSDRQQGVILSTEDQTMRFFFGYSKNRCKTLAPGIPAATYAKGIASLKRNHLHGSIKSFIVPGKQHTFINSASFYKVNVGGQSMASWVSELIENRAVDRP